MNIPDKAVENFAPPGPARRTLLAGFASAYTASLIPWALAQAVADADQGAFLALSAILAGRQSLDAAQANAPVRRACGRRPRVSRRDQGAARH